MKTIRLMIMVALLAPAALAQAPLGKPSPAEQAIAWAQAGIKQDASRVQPYNDLALGYIRRARETSDARYYEQAEAAIQKARKIDPDNFETSKAEVMLLLGRKEFATALDSARALNKKMPDDVLVYGLVADADIELGNYKEAEWAAQWMLDMRPGNVPGLLRGGRLRVLFGDAEGAMDFYNEAYQKTPPVETESQAWILTQMAALQESAGNIDAAEKLVRSALDKFPNYYLAVEAEAQVKIDENKPAEAVQLLRERNGQFPTLASKYALAKAMESAGMLEQADGAYAAFESAARAQIGAADNANLELVHYYLGRGNNPGEAMRIAKLEAARRQDAATLDAHAWSLYANAWYVEAQAEMAKALAVGVRDAAFFYHAGAIAARGHDAAAAARFLNEALQLNPPAEIAGPARAELQKLQAASAASPALTSNAEQMDAAGMATP
jgi:tetratricopeptide (TPR) repeat protein